MTDVSLGLHELDPYDDAAVADLLAFSNAVMAADEPWFPPALLRPFTGELRHGWDGEAGRSWLLREGERDDGPIVGRLAIYLPERDNRHLAELGVTVHPDHRRRGLGRSLFEAGRRLAGDAGRRLVTGNTLDAAGPIAYAEALGFTRGSIEVHRRQDLEKVDRAGIEALRAAAEAAAIGYELLRIVGPVPEERLDQVAALTAAINDAPTDDMDVEDHVFDAERVRAFDRAQAAWGRRIYRLIAQRRSDGAQAGHTIVGLDPERPDWADQYDTSVLKDHRGHRLGLLLKTEMLSWLAEAEPEVRYVDTWNAESNAHMIAVNEQLGYRVVSRYLDWQRAA